MPLYKKKCRLLTRSDFDGLACAVLLRHLALIDEILFVHPKDMQDGLVEVGSGDITINLPYVAGVHLAFDHQLPETLRAEGGAPAALRHNHIIEHKAPCAARIVYAYYGGGAVFPAALSDMMAAVDKCDSARLSERDVLDPQGWELLNFLLDARTGLGHFRQFRISTYNLMLDLIDHCKDHGIGEIMALPDVRERSELYVEHSEQCKAQIRRCAVLHKNLVVLDLRAEQVIYAGNRFLIYALFPEANVSMHVLAGPRRQNTVFATGASILNPGCRTNLGALMREYGGGGQRSAGTCQVSNALADDVLAALLSRIVSAG